MSNLIQAFLLIYFKGLKTDINFYIIIKILLNLNFLPKQGCIAIPKTIISNYFYSYASSTSIYYFTPLKSAYPTPYPLPHAK